jgi:hypothetical protein
VTRIEFGLTSTGVIFTVNIFGDGVARSQTPNDGGCNKPASMSGIKNMVGMDFASDERITKIEVW